MHPLVSPHRSAEAHALTLATLTAAPGGAPTAALLLAGGAEALAHALAAHPAHLPTAAAVLQVRP